MTNANYTVVDQGLVDQEMSIVVDEGLKKILHSLDANEFSGLKSDIQKNGIREPIEVTKLDDGRYVVVDGMTRWNIAQEIGLERVPYTLLEFEDGILGIRIYILEKQLSRRNIKEYFKLRYINELGEHVRTLAMKRKGKRGLDPNEKGKSCIILAEKYDTSQYKVDVSRRIFKEENSDVDELYREGKISLTTAGELCLLPKETRDKLVKASMVAKPREIITKEPNHDPQSSRLKIFRDTDQDSRSGHPSITIARDQEARNPWSSCSTRSIASDQGDTIAVAPAGFGYNDDILDHAETDLPEHSVSEDSDESSLTRLDVDKETLSRLTRDELKAAREKTIWDERLKHLRPQELPLEERFRDYYTDVVRLLYQDRDERSQKKEAERRAKFMGLSPAYKEALLNGAVKYYDIELLMSTGNLAGVPVPDIEAKAREVRAEKMRDAETKKIEAVRKAEERALRQDLEDDMVNETNAEKRSNALLLESILKYAKEGIIYCPIHGRECGYPFKCGLSIEEAAAIAQANISDLRPTMKEKTVRIHKKGKLPDGTEYDRVVEKKILKRVDLGKRYVEDVAQKAFDADEDTIDEYEEEREPHESAKKTGTGGGNPSD